MPQRNRESSRSHQEGVRENQTRLVRLDGVLFAQRLETEGSSQPGGTPVSDFSRHLRNTAESGISRDNIGYNSQVEMSLRGGGKDKKLTDKLSHVAKMTFKGITEKSIDKQTRKRMDQIQTRLDSLLGRFKDLVTASKSHYDVVEWEIKDFHASYPCVPLRNRQIKRINELHDSITSKQFGKEWEEITARQNKEEKLNASVLGGYLTDRENSLNRWELWVAELETRNDEGWTRLVTWWQDLRAELARARPLEYEQYQQIQQQIQEQLDRQYAQETREYASGDYIYNAGTDQAVWQGQPTAVPAYVRGPADYPAPAEEEDPPDYDYYGAD